MNTLADAKVPVVALIPKEGATGWADSYMVSSKAQHPNCAYKWMQYITQPKPQAQQAIYFGETPVADCGNGQKNCMDLRAWTTAWTQVKG